MQSKPRFISLANPLRRFSWIDFVELHFRCERGCDHVLVWDNCVFFDSELTIAAAEAIWGGILSCYEQQKQSYGKIYFHYLILVVI